MITVRTIDKIQTKEKNGGRPNGLMIPLWKDYDNIVPPMHPRFVYAMTCAPQSSKGPYLHTKRRGLLTLIQGSAVVVYQEENEFREIILNAMDGAAMLDIPMGTGYLIYNPSSDIEALFINICDYPWKKDDNETLTPDFRGWRMPTL